jgi:hypothetical protein
LLVDFHHEDHVRGFVGSRNHVRYWHKTDMPIVAANVRFWHLADIEELLANVRFQGKVGIVCAAQVLRQQALQAA